MPRSISPKDNFGAATAPLGKAFELGLASAGWDFFDDLLRLLCLAEARGYGERLIGWFESSGFDVKYAPSPRRLRRLCQGRALPARRQPGSPPPSSGFLRQALGAEAAYRRGAGWQAEARAEAKSVGQTIHSVEPRKCAKAKSSSFVLSLESNSCYRSILRN